jgi:ubiquinone/menaquinone biosynthesis C-methylase UbiE
MKDIYESRFLSEGYPDMERLAFERYQSHQGGLPDDGPRMNRVLQSLARLVPLDSNQSVCVIGCGPVPKAMRILRDRGFKVTGIEPVPLFVQSANEYLGEEGMVLQAAAESMPLPSESQDVVFFDNVMEHVESPSQSLSEMYRVLKPGGIAYVTTLNRHKVSLVGHNPEYHVPFFNWFPRLLKESFVFKHLHYEPALGNFTQRPAVHWFTFEDLCAAGRVAGFAQFYSPFDLRTPADAAGSGSAIKRWILGRPEMLWRIQRSALIRTLVLSQIGSEIIMWKRRA